MICFEDWCTSGDAICVIVMGCLILLTLIVRVDIERRARGRSRWSKKG